MSPRLYGYLGVRSSTLAETLGTGVSIFLLELEVFAMQANGYITAP